MSLNEIIDTNVKPWLNIQADNLIIDGNLTSNSSSPGDVLGIGASGNVGFGELLNIVDLDVDAFGVIPIINASTTKLNFEQSIVTPNNFNVDSNNDLVCITNGAYLVVFKFLQGTQSPPIGTANPQFKINGVLQQLLNLPMPYATTTISDYCGYCVTNILSLAAGNVVSVQLQVSYGTINMMNESFASNIVLIKVA